MNEIDIMKRLEEMTNRATEIKEAAPKLAERLDRSILLNDRAGIMYYQLSLISIIMELDDLNKEIVNIKNDLINNEGLI